MSPPLRRLKSRPEFLRVARRGRKWVTPGLVLQADRQGAEAAEIGVGFTASRKVGNAVERNRARRRLKAAVSEVVPLDGRAGCDYVVIARAATLRRPYRALLDDLRQALGKLSGGAGKARSDRPARRPEA